MKTLTIRLAGPLQSYGNEATFNYRTTYRYPSKSAVLGMIGAALGYDKYDQRYDKKLLELNSLLFATRVDQPGKLMTDYQTIKYQKRKKIEQKITHRDYLQDAVFMVAIGSEDEDFIDTIEKALHNPVYFLKLGRLSNPPAGYLQTKLYPGENPVEVLKRIDWQASKWYQRQFTKDNFKAKIVADAQLLPGKRYKLVKDLIGSFNDKDFHHQARLVAYSFTLLKNQEKHLRDNDIMAFL